MRHNIRSTKAVAIILLLATLVFGVSLLVDEKSSVSDSQYVPVGRKQDPTETRSNSYEVNPWTNYSDAQYGFSFKYPARWGTVVQKVGNRKLAGDILCGHAAEIRKGGYCVACIFDEQITFSQAPHDVWIRVLQLQEPSQPLNLCQGNNDRFVPSQQWEQFESFGQKYFFMSYNGNKIYSPGYFSDFENQAARSYYALIGDLWIEAGLDYRSPAGSGEMLDAQRNYPCSEGVATGAYDCALVGVLKSAKPSRIRDEFNAFRGILESLSVKK